MTDRPLEEEILMSIAWTWSRRGTCPRLRVGAVLARDGRIISSGYNGAPSKLDECSHDGSEDSCSRAVHAEMNTILFAARTGVSTRGAELYTTHSPCVACAQAAINAGVAGVCYWQSYRSSSGLDLLEEAGVPTRKFKERLWK